jgi:hypothetical protein
MVSSGMRQVPPKHQLLQEPHGVTSQKTPFFKENTCLILGFHGSDYEEGRLLGYDAMWPHGVTSQNMAFFKDITYFTWRGSIPRYYMLYKTKSRTMFKSQIGFQPWKM